MDIFQNQCSESLGFDSMLSSNHLNSPLHDSPGSPNQLTFAVSPYFSSISQQSGIACGTNGGGHTSGPNDVILPSIFVKIPTQINQQYQQENRLRASSGSEIKCEDRAEPIKSEIADTRVKLASTNSSDRLPDVIDNYLNDAEGSSVQLETPILVCDHCPYATLSETRLAEHTRERHASGETLRLDKLECPVCENKFYKKSVLELHLAEDHEMIRSEVEMVSDRVTSAQSNVVCGTEPASEAMVQTNNPQQTQSLSAPAQNKSRIYIKNVQLLKKPDIIAQETRNESVQQGPQLHLIEQPPAVPSSGSLPTVDEPRENQLPNGEDILVHEQAQQPTNMSTGGGSKIFIRNVSLLQNLNFIPSEENIVSQGGKYSNTYMTMDSLNDASSHIDTLTDGYNCLGHASDATGQQPRSSRIYIKNVDILRNPLISLGESTTASSVSTFNESVASRTSSCESIICTSTPPASAEQSMAPPEPTATASSVGCFSQIIPSATAQLAPSGDQSMMGTEITYTVGGPSMDNVNRVLGTMGASQPGDPGSSNLLMVFSSQMDGTGSDGSFLTGSSSTTHHNPVMTTAECGVVGSLAAPSTGPMLSTDVQQLAGDPGQRKSKIFIKNISVLKQPTIHLKSVDEVNLMTYDQLQNMIPVAPIEAGLNADGMVDGQQDGLVDGAGSQPSDADQMEKPFAGIIELDINHTSQDDTIEGYSESDLGYGELSDVCDFTEGFNDRDDPGGGGNDVRETNQVTDVVNVTSGDTLGNGMLGDVPHCDTFQNGGFDSDLILLHPNVDSTGKMTQDAWPSIELGGSSLSQDILEPLECVPSEECTMATVAVPPSVTVCQRREEDVFLGGHQVINLDPPPDALMELGSDGQSEANQAPEQRFAVQEADQPASNEPDADRPRARGRPKGAKQSGITKLKKLYNNLTVEEEGYKCDQKDCGVRFRQPDRLEYHRKCHLAVEPGTANESAPTAAICCPECGSVEFRNWNTLHTHLWREHNVDMELYACHLCGFKTPVLCRLNNTHMKIHSEERNFKCAICGKAFKNNKQLRNHRRWHREPQQGPAVPEHCPPVEDPSASGPKELPVDVPLVETVPKSPKVTVPPQMKCVKCGLRFTSKRQLRAHMDAKHPTEDGEQPTPATATGNGKHRCLLCGMVFRTRYLLQSHAAKHSDEKRFKCDHCEYTTNDHNAFRRHKMRHSAKGAHMYKCSYCEYTSIQSTTYRKHLERMHAEVASALLYKCTQCPFVSISELKYQLHRAKHDGTGDVPRPEPDVKVQDQVDVHEQELTLAASDAERRQCESAGSDVVIVEHRIETAPLDMPSIESLAPHQEAAAGLQIIQHPIIRPAMFANNFSKVDNFYGYQPQQQLIQPKMINLSVDPSPHGMSPLSGVPISSIILTHEPVPEGHTVPRGDDQQPQPQQQQQPPEYIQFTTCSDVVSMMEFN